jgi:ankyrin repeat protein
MSAYSQLLFVFIKGRVECVEVLIAAKADVNARDNDQDTALLQAVGGGHIDVVRLLLTAGADVQVPCCAYTLIHGVAVNQHTCTRAGRYRHDLYEYRRPTASRSRH